MENNVYVSPDKEELANYFDALVQERYNSIADALELCLFCTNPSICNIS